MNYEKLLSDEEYRKKLLLDDDKYYLLVESKEFESDKIEQPKIRNEITKIKGEEGCLFLFNSLILMLVSIGSIGVFFYFIHEKDVRQISIVAFALSFPIWVYSFASKTDSKVSWSQTTVLKYSKRYLFAVTLINATIVGILAFNYYSDIVIEMDLKTIGILIIILLVALLFKR